MSKYVGRILENQKGQKYKVIKRIEGQYRFIVEFLETGYRTNVHGSALYGKDRNIKDVLQPSVCGVGAVGYAVPKNHGKEYRLWIEMLRRCYDPFYFKYVNYGATGDRMSKRWLRFDYFLEDLHNLDGYDIDLFEDSYIRLVKNHGKEFSASACSFVSSKETMRRRKAKPLRHFIGYKGTKECYGTEGLRAFADKHNLSVGSISKCLNGHLNSHKGWTFCYLEEDKHVSTEREASCSR